LKRLPTTPKVVLMVTHVVPVPPAAGNEMRILKMLRWLRDEEFRVIILFNRPAIESSVLEAMKPYADALYCLGDLEKAVDPRLVEPVLEPYARAHPTKKNLCPPKLIQLTHDICIKHQPDFVIAEYIFTAPCLDVVPSGKMKLIDAHDMFSHRDPAEALFCTAEEEREYLLKADVILAIQETEASMFRDLVPEREVITVGVDYQICLPAHAHGFIPGIVMIAASDNIANQQGLKEFCSHAWPRIRAKQPNAHLRVFGKVSAGMKFADPSIHTAGWVIDLSAEYHQAEVAINPTRIGTGLKVKTLEALSHGKAFVGTPNSVKGLPASNPLPFISCDDWNTFAESVSMFLSFPKKRGQFEIRALEYSREHFNREKAYGALQNKLAASSTRS
jgi:glycosyltransferase involved in cell wall biosynthesis